MVTLTTPPNSPDALGRDNVYTLSLHDALPISVRPDQHDRAIRLGDDVLVELVEEGGLDGDADDAAEFARRTRKRQRLHSFPTRRSSDLRPTGPARSRDPARGRCPCRTR